MKTPLVKACTGCGVTVWTAPNEASLPKYTETVTCHQCGTDNSRRPPLLWRWRYGKRMLRRYKEVYGIRATIAKGPWNFFRMPYEGKEREDGRAIDGTDKAETSEGLQGH